MKFIKGFVIGTLVGMSIGSSLSEQQRKQIVQRVKKQAQPVGRAVADNVGHIADTMTEQAADTIDKAGDSVVDSIDGRTAAGDASPGGDAAPSGQSHAMS